MKRLRGRDQGKDRPACLVAASDSQTRPRFVVLLPITHTPPDGDTIGLRFLRKVKKGNRSRRRTKLGHCIRTQYRRMAEYAGLSPIPGKPGVFAMALFRPACSRKIKTRFLELARQNKSGAVRR